MGCAAAHATARVRTGLLAEEATAGVQHHGIARQPATRPLHVAQRGMQQSRHPPHLAATRLLLPPPCPPVVG